MEGCGWAARVALALTLTLAGLLAPRVARAEEDRVRQPPGSFILEVFDPARGLPGGEVRSLALGRDRLYVGTESGAAAFDGRRFQPVPTPETMRGALVAALHVEGDTLYVQTQLGLFQVRGDEVVIIDEQRIREVNANFQRGPDDLLYRATEHGVDRITADGAVERLVTNTELEARPRALHVDADGSGIWVGTPRGLFRLDGLAPGPLRAVGSLPVRAFLERDSGLIVGTELGLRDLQERWVSPEHCYATDLTRFGDGWLAASCGSGAILRWPDGAWETLDTSNGMPGAIATRVSGDHEGDLWIGTLNHGLVRVSRPHIRLWDLGQQEARAGRDSEAVSHVMAAMVVGDELLVATRSGLFTVDRSMHGGVPWHPLTRAGEYRALWEVPGEGVFALLGDQDLAQRGPLGFEIVADFGTGDFEYGFATPEGRMYLVDHTGLYEVHDQALEYFSPPDDVDLLRSRTLVTDDSEILLLGRDTLWAFDGEVWDALGPGPARCSAAVLERHDGELWAGCDGLLFRRLQSGEWARAAADQLDGSVIKAVADLDGVLWVVTLAALHRVDPEPFSLTRGTGLPDVTFSERVEPVMFQGWLATPCSRGVLWARPDALARPERAPVARVGAVFVGDREVEDLAALAADDTLLRVELESDCLGDQALVEYRFRLDGGEWSTPLRTGELHLPGLRHGDHRLEVVARYAVGPWSAEPAALAFEIPPRWYQRWEARLGFALLLLGAVFVFWRERTRRLSEALARLREQEEFRQVFGQFVTREVADEALAGRLSREGERREVSVLFADIQGFTPLSEALEPDDLVALLNTWFTAMVEAIESEGGVVNKFVGDAVIAIFGAPRPQDDHADRAVRAASQMREVGGRLAAEFERRYGRRVRAGIGVNSGEVVAGPVGAESRMEYTVIGEPVNVAARVEALTRKLDASILVTEATRSRLGAPDEFALRARGGHSLKGVARKIEVYELA